MNKQIPKILWMLWLQGMDNAPYVVQKCAESWKKQNPNWEIRYLDENTVKDYLDIDGL